LSLSVVEYQTAVLRGDMAAAAEILPTLPKDQLNKVARFLEGRGLCSLTLDERSINCLDVRSQGARSQNYN